MDDALHKAPADEQEQQPLLEERHAGKPTRLGRIEASATGYAFK